MIEKDEIIKELGALTPMDLSIPEKIALGLLIFTKYKRDFTPFADSADAFIAQEEEFSYVSKGDAKELEELGWKQQTQYLWRFKI